MNESEPIYVAPLSKRFFASFLDSVPLSLLSGVDPLVLAAGGPLASVIYFPVVWQLGWLYSSLFHAWRGQTPGKMLLGIRVVEYEECGPIGLRRAVLRDLPTITLTLVSTAFWLHQNLGSLQGWWTEQDEAVVTRLNALVGKVALSWGLLEMVSAALHPQSRAIHDLLAGTLVIRVPEKGLPDAGGEA